MSLSSPQLADELIRIIEINRTIINGLTFGEIIFKSYRGQLVEVTATETLRMAAGSQLCPLSLKEDEFELTASKHPEASVNRAR